MSDKTSPSEIQNLLTRFVELEAMAPEQINTNNAEALAKTVFEGFHVERRLRKLLAFQGHVAGNEETLDAFRRREFWLQRAIAELGLELTEEWDPDFPYTLDPHLNALFDFENPEWPDPINERLLKVPFMVTKQVLPDWVVRHLGALRRCYALEMYEAAWIFLRALIEAVSFEWLRQSGSLKGPQKVRYLAERHLKTSLDMVAEHASLPISEIKKIRQLVRRANDIVHSKHAIDTPSEADTLEAIRRVVLYAELLFKKS